MSCWSFILERRMVTSQWWCYKSKCPNTNRYGSPRVGNNNIACRCERVRARVCVEGVNRPETKKECTKSQKACWKLISTRINDKDSYYYYHYFVLFYYYYYYDCYKEGIKVLRVLQLLAH